MYNIVSSLVYINIQVIGNKLYSDVFNISQPMVYIIAVLGITVGHWPFSDQFQHLASQNPFWSANFTVHFQWDGNQ